MGHNVLMWDKVYDLAVEQRNIQGAIEAMAEIRTQIAEQRYDIVTEYRRLVQGGNDGNQTIQHVQQTGMQHAPGLPNTTPRPRHAPLDSQPPIPMAAASVPFRPTLPGLPSTFNRPSQMGPLWWPQQEQQQQHLQQQLQQQQQQQLQQHQQQQQQQRYQQGEVKQGQQGLRQQHANQEQQHQQKQHKIHGALGRPTSNIQQPVKRSKPILQFPVRPAAAVGQQQIIGTSAAANQQQIFRPTAAVGQQQIVRPVEPVRQQQIIRPAAAVSQQQITRPVQQFQTASQPGDAHAAGQMLLFGLLPPPGSSLTAQLGVPIVLDDDEFVIYLSEDEDDDSSAAIPGSPMSHSGDFDE
jgi:hypothetical protein